MEDSPRAPMRSAGLRARRVVPFVGVTVASLPLVLIGWPANQSFELVWVAIGLFLLTAALLVAVPWWQLPHPARLLVVATYCCAVAALRDAGGGATGGYGILLILPIVWLAVYGRRFEVLASVGLSGLTFVLPIAVIGGSAYPVSEWRRAALTMMAFALTGIVVNELVSRIDRHQRRLATVVEATTTFRAASLGRELCAATVEATDATVAAYHELRGDEALVSLASQSGQAMQLDDAVPLPEEVAQVAGTGVPTHTDGSVSIGPIVDPRHVVRSVLRQPVMDGDQVIGVLEVGWKQPLRHLDGEVRQVVAILAREAAAVTSRDRLIARLDELANLDQLTGVLNRRAWDDVFAREMARVARYGDTTTLALLDLDLFKQYNDRHGHLAGDDLLVAATTAWRAELRSVDVLARWGGEEFVLLLTATDVETASAVLDRLRDVTPAGQSFSAGLVSVSGEDAYALIRAADDALYRAKDGGRNRNEVALLPVA